MMIERVFVPLDGTAEAESLLPWLTTWNLKSARFILFHCLSSRLPKGEILGTSRFETPEEATEYLSGVARRLPGETEIIVRSGFPGDRIVTAALQAEADLVVLSAAGDYPPPRTLGKVTDMVARTCPLPVLLARAPLGSVSRRVRRILVPLQGSVRGDENLEILRGIAGDLHSEVILLHVGSPEPEPMEPGSEELPAGSPASQAQYLLMHQVWNFLKDSIAVSDVRLNLIQQVWAFLKKEVAARTVMTKGCFVEETLSHERSLDADIVAIARDGAESAPAWSSILRRAERSVLLYENPDLNGTAVLPIVRDRAVTVPQTRRFLPA
jgi:nucleotide-binding universal stress UspA family protein